MKIEFQEGCDYSLTIDGTESADMTSYGLQYVIKRAVDKIQDIAELQTILESIVELRGEYEDLGYCETCGSYNSLHTLEI